MAVETLKAGGRLETPGGPLEHLRLPDAAGRPLVAYKVDGRELIVRLRGGAVDLVLECACGRLHWIVREQFGGIPSLRVTCHHCGRSGSFPLEGAVLPEP